MSEGTAGPHGAARPREQRAVTVIWTGERHRRQGQLVAGMYRAAAGVPCERSAVIAGGLPGADKDAALRRSGVDPSRYLTVSIDAVLDQMASARLIPESDGLSPLMRAGQVHAEAQHVAKRVLLRALMDGRNLILDISLASWRAAEAWTYALRYANYTLTAVFADIGVDEAVRLASEARRRGEEEFRRGHGHRGRGHPRAGQPDRDRGGKPHQVGGRCAVGRGDRRHRRHRGVPRQRRDRD